MVQPANPDDPPSDMYSQRVANGTYDELIAKLEGLRDTFLGKAIFNKHFAPSIIEWSKNQMYRGLDGDEFRANIIGQLAASEEGTALGAGGAFRFEGEGGRFEPITDSTKVKDRLVLKCPSLAPQRLANMFFNQIATLNDAREYDEGIEKADGKNPLVYEQWTKCSVPDPSPDPDDMICINLGPKYTVPASVNGKRSSASSPPKKRLRRQETDDTGSSPSTNDANSESHEGTPASSQSSASTVPNQVGDLYDPTTQRDYGGPGFQHDHAKLVQRDVRDVGGRLIHPKDYFDALRPGCMILVNATMHCFILPPNEKQKRERKFYQINAHSIRVIIPSVLPPEVPRPRISNGTNRTGNGGDGSPSTQAYEAFTLASVVNTTSPPTSPSAPTTPNSASSTQRQNAVLVPTQPRKTPVADAGPALGTATTAREDGELDDNGGLEYVDVPKAKKTATRKNANGKRTRGEEERMECD